jgi:hypothetical protein
VHCGRTGLANIEKRHRGSKICIAAKAKRDKQGTAKKKTTLFTYFKSGAAKAANAVIPSTIQHSSPIFSHTFIPEKALDDEDAACKDNTNIVSLKEVVDSSSEIHQTTNRDLLERLHDLISNLPNTIPEASDTDILAVFSGNPHDIDIPSLTGDALWEELLNGMMKSAFGWGDEGKMEDIIRRGRKGLDGLFNFVKHFIVKRGVSEGLFEGKLMNLMTSLEKM